MGAWRCLLSGILEKKKSVLTTLEFRALRLNFVFTFALNLISRPAVYAKSARGKPPQTAQKTHP